MARERTDPSDQIPEADLLEQQTPLNPPPLSDAEDTHVTAEAPAEIDEADRSEQQAPVPAAEDDYPHELDQPRCP